MSDNKTNAFKKDDQEAEEESFFGYISNKFHEKFVNNIPSESILELPPKFIIPVGTVAYLATLLCFSYFAYTAYNIERKQQFISLSSSDGECDNVPELISGDYIATSEGIWEGATGYQAQFGKYTLQLVEYSNDDSGYANDMMKYVLPGINELAVNAVNYDAMENLLLWMAWEVALHPVEGGANVKDKLLLNAEPIYLFNKAHISSSVANQYAECEFKQYITSFDVASAGIRFQFDYNDFKAAPTCNTTATLEYLGYSELADHGLFTKQFDVNTLVVASAVNKGVISADDLIVINGSVSLVPVPDSTDFVEFSQRYHPQYPGMDLLNCILFPGLTRRFCVVILDDTLGYPLLNHNGNGNDEVPEACDCSKDDDRSATSPCQEHNFLIGVLFYNLPSTEEAISTGQNPQFSNQFAIAQLVLKLGLGNIDKMSFNASYAASRPGVFVDPDWRKNAYDFCELPGFGGCSLMMFHTYETGAYFVNKHFYAVKTPACTDTFSVSMEQWTALATVPPTRLTATYYACTSTVFDAIFNSIGISIGNVQFFVPLFMLLVMPLVYFYLLGIGHAPPKLEYEKEEYEASLQAFANIMLRLRDGKTRNLDKKGVLVKIVKELKKAATVEGGYPDSDDDSDSDDDNDSDSDGAEEELTSDPSRTFGSHNVFKRKSSDNTRPASSDSSPGASGSAKRKTLIKRLSSAMGANNTSLLERNNSSKRNSSSDVEMGTKSMEKTNSSFMLKQEKKTRRLSQQMQKLAVTIVNVPVEGKGKKKRGLVLRNKEKIQSLINEALEGMQKAYSVRSVDGFLDVYRVAAKKCANIAIVDLDFVPDYRKLYTLITLHTALLLQCPKEDLIGPILDTYAYQFFMRHESIRQLRILATDCQQEDTGNKTVCFNNK